MRDEDACAIVSEKLKSAQVMSQVDRRPSHDVLANDAAELLVKSSLKAGTMDNVTVIVGIFHYTAS